jgi:aldose 1-epimerase
MLAAVRRAIVPGLAPWLLLAALPAFGDVSKMPYGTTPDGQAVDQYTITNGRVTAKVITYGGIITNLIVPDRDGKPGDVVLGFDDLSGYTGKHPYFGALVGRYANRIAKGKFSLDGKDYTLATNDGPNALHGGLAGFDKKVWTAEPVGPSALKLTYTSPAGEEGYPGSLTATVTYTVTDDDALRIDYEATADAPTPVNLTNHTYFNLTGVPGHSILRHAIQLEADSYTPVDDTLIPTGKIDPVEGTPLDFRTPHAIGERIADMKGEPGGYDHNFVLRSGGSAEPVLAATVTDPHSGRVLTMLTTEPGVQFYTGNFLDSSNVGKAGTAYPKHSGLCLEAQHFPDSVNQPSFPPVILKPGETYRQTTLYKFAAK